MTNKKAKGKRSKTRRKFKGGGRKTVSQLVRGFEEEDVVQVCIDSSFHSALPAARFQGLAGKVVGKRGTAYEIIVNDGNTSKMLIVHAAHLKKLGGDAS
mgnify:CR=1 FL=1